MKSTIITSALALVSSVVGAPLDSRQSGLQQVTDFGENSSGTKMYIYVPSNVDSKPPVIVAIHYCQGTAQAYFTGSPYAQLADQYGFIVIYPESPYEGTCWDVSSSSALSHNGGGDSNSIANMVSYTLDKYNGDASQVFVTGSSSGAMMTNVMAATYPGLFKAATAYSGVPAGCFLSTADQEDAWNSTCAQGKIDASPQYWAGVVEDMYPSFDGTYPRFQVYHGDVDTTLHPPNYNETVKQWTGVSGLDNTSPDTVKENFPAQGYTTDIFGVTDENPLGTVQGIYVLDVGHTVPINGTQDMMWFELGPYANSNSGASAQKASSDSNAASSSAAGSAPAQPTTSSAAGGNGNAGAGNGGGNGFAPPQQGNANGNPGWGGWQGWWQG